MGPKCSGACNNMRVVEKRLYILSMTKTCLSFKILMRVITQVPYEKRGVTHRKTLHMRMRLTYTKMRQTHNNYITPHLPFPQYMKIVRTTTISIKYKKYIIICSKRQKSTEVFKNI